MRRGSHSVAHLALSGLAVLTGASPWGATAAAAIPAATPAPTPAGAARSLCAADSGRTTGALADPALVETSGLAWSRAHRGVRWAHNDSGDIPRIFAVGRDGATLGTVTVTGADATDWEDMARGRGPGGGDHLFLADIGGGASGGRSTVTVYRIPEPAPPGAGATAASARAQAVTLRYPDGPHDAEALLVDDRTADLVVVTKGAGSPAGVYRAPGGATAPAGTELALEATGVLGRPANPGTSRRLLDLAGLGEQADLVTAADAAPDAGVAVVRTYGGVAVYRWPVRRSLAAALLTQPCAAPAPLDVAFPQGEAIACAPDGRRCVMVSEGVNAPLVEIRADSS